MKNKIRDYRAKLLAVTLLLSGCSGSAPNSGGQPAPAADAEDILAISNPVFMDSLGVVPTKGSYLINVNNLGDKNYSLESVKITDSNGKDQSALLAVSSQMCQRLTANGSCSIEFSPRTASSATLLMTVNLRDSNNEPLKVNQVIRMSDALGANTGISFATELGEVVTEKGDYRITIPVVLNEDFDKVEAFNGSLLCNGGAYKKGNTCTYLISGHALSDNTVVSAKISAYQADNLVFAQAENTTIKIAFIPHLVMSQGVKLQANGESAATIVVYNGGTADESSISYTTNLPGGKLTSNLCGAIKTGKMCDITLQAVSETHGVGNVTAAYGESRQVSTRIAYSGTTKAELKFEAETGDSLENVLLGETANKTIKIKNTGKNGLQAFTVSLLNAGKGLTLDSSDCNRSLAAGGQCSIKINYTPTEAKASSFAEILVTTKYNGGQGELKAYTIRRDIKYSAIDSQNVLAISSPANMTIVADDVSTAKQSVTINRTSAGSLDVNLKSVGLNKIVDKLNIDNSSSCKTTNSILSESKPGCTSDLSYGPVLNPSNKTTSTPDVALSVEYSIGKKTIKLSSPTFNVRAESASAIIKPQSVTESSGTTNFTGKGTSTDPYKFIALSGQAPLVLTYTFKNVGNIAASNVNIGAGADLPHGVKVKTNNCASENSKVTLAKDATCSISLIIPDPEVFNDIAHTGSTLAIQTGNVALPLSISYSDAIGTHHMASESSRFISFSRNWAGISYTTKSITKANGAWKIVLQATVNPANDSYYPINITPLQKVNDLDNHLDQAINIQGCTIQSPSKKTCDLSFELPVDRYPESGEIQVETEVSSASLDSKDVIHANHNVEYSNEMATGYVKTMWAQPKYNGVISHGAGESLVFEVTFNKPIAGNTLKAEISNVKYPENIINLNISSDDCSRAAASCTVKGSITMPKLDNGNSKDNMAPVSYELDLNLSLISADSTTQTHTVKIHESGQYVQPFGKKVGGAQKEVVFISDDNKSYYGFTVKRDDVILDGPEATVLAMAGHSYSAVTVRATNLDNGWLQKLTVYATRYNSSTLRSLGQHIGVTDPNGFEALYVSTTIPDQRVYAIYQSIGNNHFSIYSTPENPQADLNAKVPSGHYVATFYFVRNGKPIKIDLDWTK